MEKGQSGKNLLSEGADALCPWFLGHKRMTQVQEYPLCKQRPSFFGREIQTNENSHKRNMKQALSCIFITATEANISLLLEMQSPSYF